MPLDIDFIAADQAIDELRKILSSQPHMERGEIADDIEEFVILMNNKYMPSNEEEEEEE